MRSAIVVLLLPSLLAVGANRASGQGQDHYLCYRAAGPITIDGRLDELSWEKAPRSAPFVHLVTGEPIPAILESRAALLWDDTHLYVAIAEKEEDVRADMTVRDSKIYNDWMDAEIFIAASETSDAYYEFEVNARNTVYEVFWVWKDVFLPGSVWDVPEWDVESQMVATLSGVGGHVHPRGARWGFLEWDFPGLLTAVHVDGTLNQSDDTDNGWTVEVAFPWEGMEWLAEGRSLPPQAGDVWRIDCSRFGYGRVSPEVEAQLAGQNRGWAWNQHGFWDSHMPEMFTHVRFSAETIESAPRVVSYGLSPSAVRVGQATRLELTVVLAEPLETAGAFTQMSLDLSAIGSPGTHLLQHEGAGQYTLSASVTLLQTGRYLLPVWVEAVEGGRASVVTAILDVYPAGDLVIYDDALGEGWTLEVMRAESDLSSAAFVHSGSCSHAILLPTMVTYRLDDPDGVSLHGYTHLELWINGGDASGQDPYVAGTELSQWGFSAEANRWTQVSIPVAELSDPLTSFRVAGRGMDRFYLDDIRLVAGEIPTGVEEASEAPPLPSGYSLHQNVPNPFNPSTAIAYDLPQAEHVDLDVYNITGQHVATVASGHQPAGHYDVVWDGKDASGRRVASGLYLYRLAVEGQYTQARRMVLLR